MYISQRWGTLIMAAFLSACVTSAALPVERDLTIIGLSYDDAFDLAVTAMKDLGRVEKMDKERGLIYGTSKSGVTMDIVVSSKQGRGDQIKVRGYLSKGKAGFGTINEPDKYLRHFENLSRR